MLGLVEMRGVVVAHESPTLSGEVPLRDRGVLGVQADLRAMLGEAEEPDQRCVDDATVRDDKREGSGVLTREPRELGLGPVDERDPALATGCERLMRLVARR